jgi:hypothetical protein
MTRGELEMTTTNGKPALYWVMLVTVFIAFISVAASARAEKPISIEKLVTKVEETHVPQMLATIAVDDGLCVSGGRGRQRSGNR